jgi:putative zinc finger/helix-turn-helix YgiT family protein
MNRGKGFCETCGKEVEGELVSVDEESVVRGIKVKTAIAEIRCPQCGSFLDNGENDRHNDLLIYDAYKKEVGLLTSEEIRSIRKKLGMSQRAFAAFLGLGEKDIARYETGTIQNRSIDFLMRIASEETGAALLKKIAAGEKKSKSVSSAI